MSYPDIEVTHIPVYKKVLSYLYPVLVRTAKGDTNPLLELYLYRGRWQLATHDAMYSDGDRYRPLVLAFNEIKKALFDIDSVLVLGAGLGSAVSIMNKMGYRPLFTLVDIDKVVLQWALELHGADPSRKINPVCADAQQFVNTHREHYDLLVVDVFMGRVVPPFVQSTMFLEQCRNRLSNKGIVVLNYIINSLDEWELMEQNFKEVYPNYSIVKSGINRILISSSARGS